MNNTSKKPRKTSSSAEQLAACSLISGIAGIICSLFYLPFSLVSGKNTPMEAAELVNAFYERKRHYPLPNELTEEEIYYKSDSTFGGRFNSFDEFIEWCKQQKK